jgi:RimJ/RimL family protein N-acetyltransferase
MNNEMLLYNLINYLTIHEMFFIGLFNEFRGNYFRLPNNIKLYPVYINDKIDSLVGYTNSGHYYLYSDGSNIDDIRDFINSQIHLIFSLYGEEKLVKSLLKTAKKSPVNQVEYKVMFLDKNDFKYHDMQIKDYFCIKCGIKNFDELKKLQELYHKEEVYDKNSYYPYLAEMNSFKDLLKTKLTYGVYKIKNDHRIFIAKANVNGDTPNLFQLGGIFTQKEYRGKGLAMLCLNNIINDIFTNHNKKGISLFVKRNNTPAINLYLKLGFKIIYNSSLCYF